MEKSKIMFIIIIVLLVALIGIASFISIKLIGAIGNEEEGGGGSTQQVSTVVPIEDIKVINLATPISTNLKTGPSGIEYSIRLSIGIGVNNSDPKTGEPIVALLSANETIVRDICLSVITNMTYDEITAGDKQAILSKAILLRLQEEFETNLIYDVYVSDIYIQ